MQADVAAMQAAQEIASRLIMTVLLAGGCFTGSGQHNRSTEVEGAEEECRLLGSMGFLELRPMDRDPEPPSRHTGVVVAPTRQPGMYPKQRFRSRFRVSTMLW